MEFFQLLFIINELFIKCSSTNTSYFEITVCYDNVSISYLNKTKPRVVDVLSGGFIHLWCHFCGSEEDYYPKLWFYKPRGNKPFKELLVKEIVPNALSTKLSMTPYHMLDINNFNADSSGIYMCKSPVTNRGIKYLYILEGVINIDLKPKVGTFSQWQEYKRNYLDSLNKQFLSEGEPFRSFRKKYNITCKLTTAWEKWGECKEIDHQKGVRKRIGRCRLRTSGSNNISRIALKNATAESEVIIYLTDGFDISCRSLQLNKSLPGVSKRIRTIPDFEEEEPCHVLKRAAKPKISRDKNKRKTMKLVAENSHVTLSCTEVNSNPEVQWLKDEKLLNSLFSSGYVNRNSLWKNEEEPHISVDTNNSLHLLHISKNEEGNYSCRVNGKKIQEFEVMVVSKSKLLNQEFIRYSIYLGFVLSLTMTCYCAGVCVAWHRRSSFADPLHQKIKGNYGHNYLESEQEKLLK